MSENLTKEQIYINCIDTYKKMPHLQTWIALCCILEKYMTDEQKSHKITFFKNLGIKECLRFYFRKSRMNGRIYAVESKKPLFDTLIRFSLAFGIAIEDFMELMQKSYEIPDKYMGN